MKLLSGDVRSLLDKIYNLRSEDSVILAKMNKEREEAIETQERTKNEKEVLLNEIEKLTNDEKVLEEQGNKLIDILSSIDRDEFAVVLERLNIDFEPDMINDKVRATLPATIESLAQENRVASEKLRNVEAEMNNSITLVEELGIRKDEAISNQEKLNEYIELALSGNINITRDAITSLLEKFEFTENEQREAAKLLMFPEDALYEYDASVKSGENASGKSMAEVFVEAKESSEYVIENVDDEVSKTLEETAVSELADLEDVEEQIFEEPNTQIVDDKIDEPVSLSKEQLMEKLNNLGVDASAIAPTELANIIANYDEGLIESNIKILKEKDISLKIINNNANLLYDKELGEKIAKLLEIGKLASDISLVPNVLSKYDLKGLTNTINVLQISGLDPKKVPLMAF